MASTNIASSVLQKARLCIRMLYVAAKAGRTPLVQNFIFTGVLDLKELLKK